jgi:hypothetical protein
MKKTEKIWKSPMIGMLNFKDWIRLRLKQRNSREMMVAYLCL